MVDKDNLDNDTYVMLNQNQQDQEETNSGAYRALHEDWDDIFRGKSDILGVILVK